LENLSPNQYPQALAHGLISKVFDDVFFVSGSMETVLMELDWQFSRNMVIVREGERLIIINSVRLNEQALAELEQLGKVTDVIRLGALHGRDDAFYVDRYHAQYWTMPSLVDDSTIKVNELSPEAKLPISDASLFQFETTQIPEAILCLQREGGIAIACDALQNWLAPDEHFCDSSTERMQEMGFFTPANVGPVWLQAAAPAAADFIRLKALPFKHALCGHGEPLRDTAKEDFLKTFSQLFDI
tara:strand:+ start:1480 stop:2208 length:729 start_codon:yes stop_codon:yes gene_type:complete